MNTPLHKVLLTPLIQRLLIHKLLFIGALSGVAWTGVLSPIAPVAQAQQLDPQQRQEFLADPLDEPLDSLLPVLVVDRALSPLEISTLRNDLDELQERAEVLLQIGDTQAAFDLLLREVRLRRIFGLDAELDAIERVADLAWQQQRPVTIQLLTLRTQAVWNAAKTSLGVEPEDVLGGSTPGVAEDSPIRGVASADRAALTRLADIFLTLRDIDSAVEVYQQLIALSEGDPREGDIQTVTAQKIALAELNLEWFKFADAANLYLDLLNQNKENGESANEITREIFYLERLAYSYQQAESWSNALRSQTDLLDRYVAIGEEEKLPGLLVAIAQNYQTTGQPSNAIRYYRSAYTAAQQLEQFSFSAKVLQELGRLYKSADDLTEALVSYNLLVLVERQAYNAYGIMNAYDNLGQIYREQGELSAALQAFQQGLVFADRLDLRTAYFAEQIDAIAQELSELEPIEKQQE
ncbi:MAG: tetratricopeptide repeat protein [Cyanobacteria bacterium P01_D01_bin.1]